MSGEASGPAGGMVRAIFVGPVVGGPMEAMTEVQLIAGAGIEGDRYAAGAGTFVRKRGRSAGKGLALTLIEEEAIEQVRLQHGMELDFAITRRNVVTFGIRLEALIGKQFQLGSAMVRGVALNPPCSRLEKLTGISGLKKLMAGRGGIRADVVEGGPVRVGDPLSLAPELRSGG